MRPEAKTSSPELSGDSSPLSCSRCIVSGLGGDSVASVIRIGELGGQNIVAVVGAARRTSDRGADSVALELSCW